MKAKNYVTAAARTGMVFLLMMLSGLICQGQLNKGAGGGGAEVAPQVARVDSPATANQAKTAVDSFKRENLAYGLTMSVGTRFSFLDDKASGELYYDISGFIPEFEQIRHQKSKKGKAKEDSARRTWLGVDFGISEQGAKTPQEKSVHKSHVVGQVDFLNRIDEDSVSVVYRTYQRTRTLSKEVGASIYISPTFRVTDQFFGLIHFQHDYVQRKYLLQDEAIQTDTGRMANNDYLEEYLGLVGGFSDVSSFGTTNAEVRTTAASFVGVGAIFLIKTNNESVVFRIKPVIGIQYVAYTTNGDRSLSSFDDYDAHFLLDFRIIESKEFGFKLGGALSGDIHWAKKLKDINFLAGQPIIYLSKAWDINKVTSFLKPTGK